MAFTNRKNNQTMLLLLEILYKRYILCPKEKIDVCIMYLCLSRVKRE